MQPVIGRENCKKRHILSEELIFLKGIWLISEKQVFKVCAVYMAYFVYTKSNDCIMISVGLYKIYGNG